MSRPRFLADHDLNEHLVHGVARREPAVECMRLRDESLERLTNGEILDYAAAHQCAVLSHDVNTMSAAAYARIAAGRPMYGLFLVHQRQPLGPVIDDIILIWTASEAEEWMNQVRFLPL